MALASGITSAGGDAEAAGVSESAGSCSGAAEVEEGEYWLLRGEESDDMESGEGAGGNSTHSGNSRVSEEELLGEGALGVSASSSRSEVETEEARFWWAAEAAWGALGT
jgi:hypothetical protein